MDPTSHTAPPPSAPHVLGASLRRSTTDRLLLGLCGGVARATGTNAIAVRVATLVLGALLLPLIVLAYIVTSAILPRDDGSVLIGNGGRDRRDVIVALLCTLVAAPLALGTAGAAGLTSGEAVWPLLLVASVIALLVAFARPKPSFFTTTPPAAAGPTEAWSTPPVQAPPADDPFRGTVAAPADDTAVTSAYAPHADDTAATAVFGATTASETGAASGPSLRKDDPTAVHHDQSAGTAGGAGAWTPPPSGPTGPTFTTTPQPSPEPGPRRRSLALPVLTIMGLIPALTAMLVVLGVVDGGWNTWAVMLGLLALASAGGAVAIAILRPSYLGAGLLVMLAAVIGSGAIAVNQFGPYLDDGVGQSSYRPLEVSELRPSYVQGIGQLDIDLRQLRLRPGSRTTVHARLGLGELRIAVPDGARIIAAPGSKLSDVTVSARGNGATTQESAAAPVIVLDLRVRAGEASLLSGRSADFDQLEQLARQETGFWADDNNSSSSASKAPSAPVQTP